MKYFLFIYILFYLFESAVLGQSGGSNVPVNKEQIDSDEKWLTKIIRRHGGMQLVESHLVYYSEALKNVENVAILNRIVQSAGQANSSFSEQEVAAAMLLLGSTQTDDSIRAIGAIIRQSGPQLRSDAVRALLYHCDQRCFIYFKQALDLAEKDLPTSIDGTPQVAIQLDNLFLPLVGLCELGGPDASASVNDFLLQLHKHYDGDPLGSKMVVELEEYSARSFNKRKSGQ